MPLDSLKFWASPKPIAGVDLTDIRVDPSTTITSDQDNKSENEPSEVINVSFILQRKGGRVKTLVCDDKAEITATFNSLGSKASIGAIVIVIEGYAEWFFELVEAKIKTFPTLELVNGLAASNSMLPFYDMKSRGTISVSSHIRTVHNRTGESDGHDLYGIYNTRSLKFNISSWIRGTEIDLSYDNGEFVFAENNPMIFVMGRVGTELVSTLPRWILHPGRWERLSFPYWIYLDISYAFDDWDAIWRAARNKLRNLESEYLHSHVKEQNTSILVKTMDLHRDTGTTMSLREIVRLQYSSADRMFDLMGDLRTKSNMGEKYGYRSCEFCWTQALELRMRLMGLKKYLKHLELLAETKLEQQKNLLDLLFNTEAISQGDSVARLNALALVFLPLSFVATLFGMTTFTASAALYPAYAIPTTIISILVVVATSRVMKGSESVQRPPFRTLPTQHETPSALFQSSGRQVERASSTSTPGPRQQSDSLRNLIPNHPQACISSEQDQPKKEPATTERVVKAVNSQDKKAKLPLKPTVAHKLETVVESGVDDSEKTPEVTTLKTKTKREYKRSWRDGYLYGDPDTSCKSERMESTRHPAKVEDQWPNQ